MTYKGEIKAALEALEGLPQREGEGGVIVTLPPDQREYLLTRTDLRALGRYVTEGAGIAAGYWLDDLRISRDPLPEEDEQ